MGSAGHPRGRLAILAGAGRFPFHVAQAAARQGQAVTAFGLRGWVDRGLAQQVPAYEEVDVGRIGTLLERLKALQITDVIMAGKVTKDVLLTQAHTFDAETQALVQGARDMSVNGLLGALAQRLAREGITLRDSAELLQDQLCPEGVVTRRAPTGEELADVRVGIEAARALAAQDVGQTVVVKRQVVVAAEALDGTDRTIQRARDLAGPGLVVVKMASAVQDRRFDLPVVGPDTIATLRACGATCLAVHAGWTLLLDRETTITAANDAGMCVLGVRVPAGG